MAVKANGIFRLVKVNADNERPVNAALEVTTLPSVFGLRDGKIQVCVENRSWQENITSF